MEPSERRNFVVAWIFIGILLVAAIAAPFTCEAEETDTTTDWLDKYLGIEEPVEEEKSDKPKYQFKEPEKEGWGIEIQYVDYVEYDCTGKPRRVYGVRITEIVSSWRFYPENNPVFLHLWPVGSTYGVYINLATIDRIWLTKVILENIQ